MNYGIALANQTWSSKPSIKKWKTWKKRATELPWQIRHTPTNSPETKWKTWKTYILQFDWPGLGPQEKGGRSTKSPECTWRKLNNMISWMAWKQITDWGVLSKQINRDKQNQNHLRTVLMNHLRTMQTKIKIKNEKCKNCKNIINF